MLFRSNHESSRTYHQGIKNKHQQVDYVKKTIDRPYCDNKTFKLSTIAKTVLPLISVAVISGCGSDSTNEDTTNPGSGLYPAGENEVVIYYKRDVASASTASDFTESDF